jgi:5-enolpyruvylshikimate-3-phosphate synthase
MTPKQQDIANRFLLKVVSLGYKVTRTSIDGLMQAATPPRGRQIEFKMFLQYGDNITVQINTAFLGTWTSGRSMTIDEFEQIDEAEVMALLARIADSRAEIKEQNRVLKELKAQRAESIAAIFKKL